MAHYKNNDDQMALWAFRLCICLLGLTVGHSVFAAVSELHDNPNGIPIDDDFVTNDTLAADQKLVVILDDSGSMEEPAEGGSGSRWNFVTNFFKDVFVNIKDTQIAMAGLNSYTQFGGQQYISPGPVDGASLDNLSQPSPELSSAWAAAMANGPQGGTPTRGAMKMAGDFLMFSPGSSSRFMLPGAVPCWNEFDYTSNADQAACSSHGLWIITDGEYRSPRAKGPATIDNPILSGLRSKALNLEGFQQAGETDDGAFPSGRETNGKDWEPQPGIDEVMMRDVAAHLVEKAQAGNFKLKVSFINVGTYSSALSIGTPSTVPDLQMLDAICLARQGKSLSTNTEYSPSYTGGALCDLQDANSWQWLPTNAREGAATYAWGSGATSVINFLGESLQSIKTDYDDGNTKIVQKAGIGLDMAYSMALFERAGMLDAMFVQNSGELNLKKGDLIKNLKIDEPLRFSPAGPALDGTENSASTALFQPLFQGNVGDIYRFELTEDLNLSEAFEGITTLSWFAQAAEEIPVSTAPETAPPETTPAPDREVVAVSDEKPDGFELDENNEADVDSWYEDPPGSPPVSKKRRNKHLKGLDVDDELVDRQEEEPPVAGPAPPPEPAPLPKYNDPYTSTNRLIGDIINSKPIVVGQPFFRSRRSSKAAYSGAPSYAAFKLAQSGRPSTLYVGANDGQLYAFNADTMEHRFSFIPSHNLLLDEDEGTGTEFHVVQGRQRVADLHKFGIDLSPVVNDVVLGGAWRTILVGGLRSGGAGYFALDVTDPTGFGPNSVLWEFGRHTDTSLENSLGLSYSLPKIVRTQPGWRVVFGNGVNSVGGKGSLFVVDVAGGSSGKPEGFKEVPIPAADITGNGIVSVTPVDVDADDIIDFFYAGDMHGNIYRVDARGSDPASWPSYKVFENNLGHDHAVANNIMVTRVPRAKGGGLMVVFATGHNFNKAALADTSIKHVIGFWDEDLDSNNPRMVTVGDLQTQTLGAMTVGGVEGRGFSDATAPEPSYDGSQFGWIVPLGSGTGERAMDMALHQGKVLVLSVEFSNVPATPAGTEACKLASPVGYLSVFDARNGGAGLDFHSFGVRKSDSDGNNSDDEVENDPEAPTVFSSAKIKDAPSKFAVNREGVAYVQDINGNLSQYKVDIVSDEYYRQRLSWQRVRR